MKIWTDPYDMEHVRALHGLLRYYAEKVAPRREADRRSKKVCQDGGKSPSPQATDAKDSGLLHGEATGSPDDTCIQVLGDDNAADNEGGSSPGAHGGLSVEYIENLHADSTGAEDHFQEVGDYIRELKLKDIVCPHGCTKWRAERKGRKD